MNKSKKFAERFDELTIQSQKIRMQGRDGSVADRTDFYSWALSSLNLIKGVFGVQSTHSLHFERELESIKGNYVQENHLDSFRGMFLAAKSDFEKGFVFDAERMLTAEVFGDFVAAAKAALAEEKFGVAAVLASAALEDALKRYALLNQLDVTGKTMEDVVNALKSKGLVSGAQKSLLAAMPRIRNHAMHAEWGKITPQDAGSIIGYVEQFLLTQFVESQT